MLRRCVLLIVLICLVASAAVAENVVIPRFSVIPVTMSSQLSSAVASPGDDFTVTVSGAKTCCFPVGTCITGEVVRVVRADGRRAGQISVVFQTARFADGSCVNINGVLATLDERNACPTPNSPCIVATGGARDARNSFIAGPNCSVWIGVLCRGNVLLGESVNVATICPPAAGSIRAAAGQDVVVTCGEQFGVMLKDPVCIAQGLCNPAACPGAVCPTPTCPAPAGAGPLPPINVAFPPAQPFMSKSVLLVPVQPVMAATRTQYTLDKDTGILSFSTQKGTATHRVGTNVVSLNGTEMLLNGFSGTVGDNIYIPADAITIVSGRDVTWDQASGNLRIQ